MSDSSGRSGGEPDVEGEPEPNAEGEPEPDAEDEQWRFGLDEVGEDGEVDRPPMEPESISVENTFFILLGAVGTVLVFWSLVGF